MQRLACFLFCLLALPATADVRLPGFFGDHMVLQRGIAIPIWGWAAAGEQVEIRLGSNTVNATAGVDGKWRAKLPAMKAGGPHVLRVAGGNRIEIKDVLIGEVWLCSGQSNMEWTVARSANPDEEIAAGDHPQIRHLKVNKKTSGHPLDDLSASWQICSPGTVANFTAAGYFMARELQKELGVPIGLLNSSWGGTRIEPWTPVTGLEQVPALAEILGQVRRTMPDDPAYQTALKAHIAATEQWSEQAKAALANGDPVPVNPEFPAAHKPLARHTDPVAIYNAMIHPLVGYGMRGAIWYQGESNHSEGMLYHEKKKALVSGWRKIWGIGDFPFYYVQIAPFRYGNEDPKILARFWEAQATSLEIPNTGMVVTSDIGNVNDIHPKNKQDVGRRLALLALKNDYGRKGFVASGPAFESMAIEGSTLRVRLANGEGLRSRDGKALTHFEIIGEQAGFVNADARIDGNSVILSSPKIKQPAAMRFAWHKLAEPNLQNGAGLPASAFRAGTIPEYDFLALKVPEAKGMELVYEMDLKKLRRDFEYTVDRSAEIGGGFDRIGYFIELKKPGERPRFAYASMDAFTEDIGKIGLPGVRTKAHFQQAVENLRVISSVDGLQNGEGLKGNIEFWPNNYAPQNAAKISGASNALYDISDQPSPPVDGYGCLQIHNTATRQTVLAVNNWKAGSRADLGIGNSTGAQRDWTFTQNAHTYEKATLKVLVRRK